MSLIENVSKGIVEAMKVKDADVLGTLRMLKTALTMREVEKGRGLEPGEELQVVASLVNVDGTLAWQAELGLGDISRGDARFVDDDHLIVAIHGPERVLGIAIER